MCGRYTITTKIALLAEYFDANVPPEEIKPNYNATPSMRLPVILDESPETITLAKWGFVPHWDKAGKMKPQINARLETAAERPTFRTAFKKHHCLVLADGFYEWRREGTSKTPFRIKRTNDEPLAMAGIWDPLPDERGAREKSESSFAILTMEANEIMRPIHDRMPTILRPGMEHDWLKTKDDDAPSLAMIETDDLTAYEVSRAVNSPRHNTPEVIEPVSSA